MRSTTTAVLLALGFALAACGSDEVAAPTTAPAAAEPGADADGAEADDTVEDDPADAATPDADVADADVPDGDTGDAAVGGRGSASLSLANGEEFTFSVLCTLEPQMAAGSEILFTATSYDDPGFDITQFGDEGVVTGLASVEVYDGDFETLWSASSIYESFGGTLEITLDGSTISGSGSFYPNDDISADPVEGTFVANC